MVRSTIISLVMFVVTLTTAMNSYAEESSQARHLIQADAERFCAVFSPEVWDEMKQYYQGAALMEEFLKRVDQAVVTPEFESILNKQHEQKKNADILYQYYVNEVSKISDRPFSCPDLKTYFVETLK